MLFLMVQTLLTVNRVSSKFEFQASQLKHNFDQWPLHWSKINLLFFLSPMAYKIINRATKDYKILIPKVIFQYQKSIESFKTRLKRLLILSSRDYKKRSLIPENQKTKNIKVNSTSLCKTLKKRFLSNNRLMSF